MFSKKLMAGGLLLTAIASLNLIATPTSAATQSKVVKIQELPALIESNFFAGNGGQWFSTLVNKSSIFLIGTSEPAVGPTEGEVIAINPRDGSELWDLHLNVNSDAVATSATFDSQGNIWVAGLSAPSLPPSSDPSPSLSPTPSPTPSDLLNPNGVSVEPFPAVRADLTQITLWKIDSHGTLLASFTFDSGKVLLPTLIKENKRVIVVSGSNFQIGLNESGSFSKLVNASFLTVKKSPLLTFKDGLYLWKSYIATRAIPGVTGWKPSRTSQSLQVITKVGSRTGNIYSAYKVTDSLLSANFMDGVGLVVTTETDNGYQLSVLK